MPTDIDSKVLLDFFLIFARFELSLKNSGFFRRHKKIDLNDPPDAHADWDGFTVSIRDSFRSDRTTALQDACDYLLSKPPWREVVIDKNSVAWRCDPPPESLPDSRTGTALHPATSQQPFSRSLPKSCSGVRQGNDRESSESIGRGAAGMPSLVSEGAGSLQRCGPLQASRVGPMNNR